MLENFITIVLQVAGTLLLGAFFGLERRLRGYPDASRLHASLAAAGMLAMLFFRPEAASLFNVMIVSVGLSFLIVQSSRSALMAIAQSRAIFSESGADTFTLSGALAVGCACGTGDIACIAAVIMIMTVVHVLRPMEERSAGIFAQGEIDATKLVRMVPQTSTSNDNRSGNNVTEARDTDINSKKDNFENNNY